MKVILWKSSLRYLLHHPWQIGLSILGVALGVAVVISIDLTNESAKHSFALSVESLTGKATHQIVGVSGGIPESFYKQVRVEMGLRNSAPVVEGVVSAVDYPGQTLRVLGVDLFAESRFRNYLGEIKGGNFQELSALMTQPWSIYLSLETAKKLELESGDTIRVDNGSQNIDLDLIGVLESSDNLANEAMRDLIIVDIATAQEILNQVGFLSSIDLILSQHPERETILENLKKKLPYGTRLQTTSERVNSAEKLTRSFHLNLAALSLLALVVGVFLIYNTMTFSVVQRYSLFGRLRALGMTRNELFVLVIGEAFLIGCIGTGLGLGLGFLLAQGLLKLVSQTINEMYYTVSVSQIYVSTFSLVKATSLGLVASLVAAFLPAREAAQISPSMVMRRSVNEETYRKALPRSILVGLGLLGLTALFLWLPFQGLFLVYAALFIMVLGFAVLMPVFTVVLMNLCIPLMFYLFKTPGLLAARGIKTELSRTSVATAALMVALATAVGVGIMVESFRGAVIQWLGATLRADIYLTSVNSQRNQAFLSPELINDFSSLEGIQHIATLRELNVLSGDEPLRLISFDIPTARKESFSFKERENSNLWERIEQKDTIIISEPLAYRLNLSIGDTLLLETPSGAMSFQILGIFYDYGSEQGYVFMHPHVFMKYWDTPVRSVAFYLAPEVDKEFFMAQLRQLSNKRQKISIRSNDNLLQRSIEVFDRTFAITRILRLLVVGVAFIGVLSALMALELEKQREMGVLRAIGLTRWQLWGVVMGQCGLMGAVAGLMAFPVGYLLAQVLVHVVNQRSFGWTFQTILPAELWGQGLLLGVIAALLAGIYPAFKMAQTSPAEALREE